MASKWKFVVNAVECVCPESKARFENMNLQFYVERNKE
jgi:hypothetical protein